MFFAPLAQELDNLFSKLNRTLDQAACQAVEFLSQWCKGRIRTRRPRPTKRRGPKSRRQRLKLPLPILLYLFAGQTQSTKPRPRKTNFSSHPFTIGIDSRASACMSPDPKDFITKLTSILVQVKTYDSTATRELHRGTIQWFWTDDEGNEHRFDIPDSYYDPAGTRLLSPQH